MVNPPDRICQSCGRTMEWRARWAKNWDEVKYCSSACRSHRPTELDRQIERLIIDACSAVAAGRSVPEPQIVRQVQQQLEQVTAERVRWAGRRLVAASRVEFIQKNRVIEPSTARGALDYRQIS